MDVAKWAWKHKKVCLPTALMAIPGTPASLIVPMACGLGFYVADKVKSAISCLGQMKSTLGSSWQQLAKTLVMKGCNLAGGFAFDIATGIILAVATGGTGLPVVIAKAAMKVLRVIKMAEDMMTAVNKLNDMGSCQQ